MSSFLPTRLKNCLLFLFLCCLPTQLGKHFWPAWSLIKGVRIDYLSPTIYFVDILAAGLILPRFFKSLKSVNLVFWPLAVLNILIAGNKWLALTGWLRILEIYLVYLTLKPEKELIRKYLGYIIPFWIILEGGLGLAQVINGGSLQGVFYWLGERRFNLNTIGIAKISFYGREILRAYGTFSHPNSLAGFLLITLELWRYYSSGWFYWLIRCLGLVTIIFSASRAAWLLLIINSPFRIYGLLFLALFGVFSGWDPLSWTKRLTLNNEAVKLFLKHPLLGIGWNNYLSQSHFYQPVHNIYLLILSQLGLIPTLILGSAIRSKIAPQKWPKRIWLIILITSLFDHYWLTLPQNWWLLTLCFILYF